ncbi:PD-(D/E)XK nuclease family protein, partial [Escherichia coli]|nr:PD-(D/E)XK nuclease family protein [Escherichia coli]
PSAKDALTHPQLGVYQAAITLGALDSTPETSHLPAEPAGATLVFVGSNTKKPSLRTQQAPTDDWAQQLIIEAAALM